MNGRAGTIAAAMRGIDDPYVVQAINELKEILIEQAAAFRSLSADLSVMEGLVARHEAERVARLVAPQTRRCPGCRSLVPASMVEHLGQCTGCADAEDRLEARV